MTTLYSTHRPYSPSGRTAPNNSAYGIPAYVGVMVLVFALFMVVRIWWHIKKKK